MKLVSVNVGLPQAILYKGKAITTGILKEPVKGRITLRRLNLDGDRQADLSVHGGPDKAVCAYCFDHYPHWEAWLGEALVPGATGVHAHGNVGRLGVDRGDDRAGFGIETEFRTGVSDLLDGLPHDVRDFHIPFGSDLSRHHGKPRGQKRLARHTAHRVLFQQRVQNSI